MTAEKPPKFRLEDRSFLVLVLVITIALGWVIEPFFGAVMWGLVAAILFAPVYQRLLKRYPGRRNSAAALTLLLIVALVIIPAIILGVALIQEAGVVYGRIQSGEINIPALFERFHASLPAWATSFLNRLGLTSFADARDMLSAGIARSFRTLAGQALLIGQGAFGVFVALGIMLYLTFFLLRDGDKLAPRLAEAVPLRQEDYQALTSQFVTVIRATIRGSIVVALLQGLIGGVVFWALGIQGALLWGVLMGFFSLFPAIGTGLVWVPVAIYLLATGSLWQGAVLVFCGLFVIGMVDNVLRPILVGREARMPDYVVLISTLGGLQTFGINGFVIGPVIAALFLAAWNILTRNRRGAAATD
jgi:predicted PurR-regulated permease PerM